MKLKAIVGRSVRRVLAHLGYQLVKPDPERDELNKFLYRSGWIRSFDIGTVIDVGANEGQFAQKILHVLPEVELYCFEPLDGPFQVLSAKFEKKKNVHLHNFALGEELTAKEINNNEHSPSSSFLTMGGAHLQNFTFAVTTTRSTVEVRRLDDLRIEIKGPLLVKIDVQGFEDKVIAGGKTVIARADVLIVEVSFRPMYEDQPLFEDIRQELFTLGFYYHGNFEQLRSPSTGEVLQADAVFLRSRT